MKLLGVRRQFQRRKRALSDRLKHGKRCYTGIGTRSDNRAVLVLAIVVRWGGCVKWRVRHLTMQCSESASGVVRGKFPRRCTQIDRLAVYLISKYRLAYFLRPADVSAIQLSSSQYTQPQNRNCGVREQCS